MIAKLKVDVINRYKEARKEERPMTQQERKDYRRAHKNATEEDLVKVELIPQYYGKEGDEVTIVSENPGAWRIVITVRNKQGECFSVKWDDLKF